jgi:hypothetical protein
VEPEGAANLRWLDSFDCHFESLAKTAKIFYKALRELLLHLERETIKRCHGVVHMRVKPENCCGQFKALSGWF